MALFVLLAVGLVPLAEELLDRIRLDDGLLLRKRRFLPIHTGIKDGNLAQLRRRGLSEWRDHIPLRNRFVRVVLSRPTFLAALKCT